VVAAVLLVLLWFVIPIVVPGATMYGIIGGVVCGLAILLWWLFFSRAPWSERLGAVALMVVALFAAKPFLHHSVAGAGMGMLFFVLAIPLMSLALVAWAAASRRLSSGLRRASMVAAILLACGVFTVVRTGGITGDGDSDLHWRWTPSPEERLLAQGGCGSGRQRHRRRRNRARHSPATNPLTLLASGRHLPRRLRPPQRLPRSECRRRPAARRPYALPIGVV